ncbi:heparinase II/III domain-containing protein [Dokdonella koreensis]|uniref:M28E family peptidase n=1 Tax=Dokdonella koreensis DS-123 TaxID=1300342 RepID=A0A160DSA8_9GAMM|nr:heparinase II/III family protein [Dokdonella koreensis]ANB17157.1 M28E family peptidase [Dokdonella koreensis DS-123]
MALWNRYSRALAAAAVALSPVAAGAEGITIDLSYVNPQSAAYTRFKSYVDAAVNGHPAYGFAATDAAYMHRLTGQAQYCNLAVQMSQAQVNAANTAIANGQRPEVAGDSYLQAGPMLMDLAITWDWCRAYVNDAQRTQWGAYAEQAIWNIWNPSQAQWGGRAFAWSGWGTNDPANNYFYSFLQATMYWSLATNSTTWKAWIQNNKLPTLEAYFANLPGGGSQEGTGYGLSHRTVFALYRLWRDSTGADAANANSHLSDTVAYWTHATVPTRDRYAPIGDQARTSQPELYDYHRQLMLEARSNTANAEMRNLASWWLNGISVQQMANSFNYRHDLLQPGATSSTPSNLTYHAPGVGQLFSRSGWDAGAMWLSFIAGPYVQSHAHQDQGAFTLYENGWLAVTENIWTSSGIQQGTDVHNVLRFVRNGTTIAQREPTTSNMTITQTGANGALSATANLTPAYGGNSAIQSWQRSIEFGARRLLVQDSYAVSADTQAIFQVNVPVQPTISGRSVTAGRLKINVLQPANATVTAVDWRTAGSDFRSGWRIEVRGGSGSYVVELKTSEDLFKNGFD